MTAIEVEPVVTQPDEDGAAAHDAGTLGPDAYATASQSYGITWL